MPEAQCSSAPPGARHGNRLLKHVGICIVGLCLLLSVSWLFRAPLLTGLARAWVVDDKLEKADAIVVLGGGIEARPLEAASLYSRDVAPKVLVPSVRGRPGDKLGVTVSETEATRRILLTNHVPESAIVIVGTNSANTYDEAVAVRDWVRQTGAKSICVTTDMFHTRRACWMFRKALRGSGAEVRLRVSPRTEYELNNWWQDEQGVVAFQNEVLKFGYYLVRY